MTTPAPATACRGRTSFVADPRCLGGGPRGEVVEGALAARPDRDVEVPESLEHPRWDRAWTPAPVIATWPTDAGVRARTHAPLTAAVRAAVSRGRHDAHRHTGLSVVEPPSGPRRWAVLRGVVGEDADPLAAEKSPLGPRGGIALAKLPRTCALPVWAAPPRAPRQGDQRRGHQIDALGRWGQQEADVVVVEEAHARKIRRQGEGLGKYEFRGPLDQNRGPVGAPTTAGALHFYRRVRGPAMVPTDGSGLVTAPCRWPLSAAVRAPVHGCPWRLRQWPDAEHAARGRPRAC